MALASFLELFGSTPQARADAPGRVNLIGEHTDYNGGFVLPAVIPQRTRIEAAPRADRTVRLWSAQYPDEPLVEYQLGGETPRDDWADYVKGMTQVLSETGRLGGFDARIESEVPVGSGLSSSAALEIAVGRLLREMFDLPVDDVALAVAGRRAENDFVGAPVGIMDQMAASVGRAGGALFIDCRTLAHEAVPISRSAALIVINSGVTHSHASGEYATRRKECSDAAAALGVAELRDIPVARLRDVERLPDPLRRRARHVVTENQRVLDAVAALRGGALDDVGRLFAESHSSMRDDFEITVPAIDELVNVASRVRGVYGARMTGGGFGGSIVALADPAGASAAAEKIAAEYTERTSHTASILLPTR